MLNKHAPIHECKTAQHVSKGFKTSEIMVTKRLKPNLESVWQQDNSALNHSRYRTAVNCFNHLLDLSKTRCYNNMVNPKALWNSVEKILHKSPKTVLPDCTTIKSLANSFGKYFTDEIAKLYQLM